MHYLQGFCLLPDCASGFFLLCAPWSVQYLLRCVADTMNCYGIAFTFTFYSSCVFFCLFLAACSVCLFLLLDFLDSLLLSQFLKRASVLMFRPLLFVPSFSLPSCCRYSSHYADIMNRDPSAAHVMYLKTVDGEGMSKLRKVTDMLARALLSEQDIKEQQIFDRSGQIAVKYHATLINTKHRANGQAVSTVFCLL